MNDLGWYFGVLPIIGGLVGMAFGLAWLVVVKRQDGFTTTQVVVGLWLAAALAIAVLVALPDGGVR